MKYNITHAERSDIGKKRKNNEDNFICFQEEHKKSLLVIGAIDGVGGYAGGEEAAKICKETVESYVSNNTETLSENAAMHIAKAMVLANNKIYTDRLHNKDLHRMSCVASFGILDAATERLYYAHIGDSRGYIFREGELIKFTKDHSMVGYLEEVGEITEEEAMRHPRRNEISQMLGEKELPLENEYVFSGEYSFYSNDIVLFCSDGLTDLVTTDEIKEVLATENTLENKKETLISLANEKGGKDNITVTLATYSKKSTQQKKVFDKATTLIEVVDEKNSNNAVEATTVDVVNEEEIFEETLVKKKRTYTSWIFFLFAGMLLGFLLNIQGSKYWYHKIQGTSKVQKDSIKINTEPKIKLDSLNQQQDSIIIQKKDSLNTTIQDSLSVPTDSIN